MKSQRFEERIFESAEYIRANAVTPYLFFVLGSGIDLSPISSDTTNVSEILWSEIPHFPEPTIAGHTGKIIVGMYSDRLPLALVFGRKHIYEGSWEDATFIPAVFSTLGAKIGVFTSSVGAVDRSIPPGSLVLLNDVLNMQGKYSIQYATTDERSYLYEPFDKELMATFQDAAVAVGKYIYYGGVYASMTGPNYETPAEVSMLRKIGASVVGMSMAPELWQAYRSKIRCLGISLVTNTAGTLSNHSDVISAAAMASQSLTKIATVFLKMLIDNGIAQK